MPDLLDRRQRQAAAILLSAVDLPATAHEVADLWLKADIVCPGISVDELRPGSPRLNMLKSARKLVDEIIAELES